MVKKYKSRQGAGPSKRQLKVNEVIRRTLSDIFVRGDLYDPELAQFNITICEVNASPDLRNATVYFFPLGGNDAELARKLLNKNKREIRFQLTKCIELKYSPQLNFEIDRTYDNIDKTYRLLSQERVLQDTRPSGEDDG